jgi:uncharacterized protein (TIGR00730 family)
MITDKKKVAVFSGANAPEQYITIGYEVGKLLGQNGLVAITGGGPGMMRAVNKGAFEQGAESWGICIEHRSEEIDLEYFTYHEIHSKFDERNDRLLNLADAFVVLPGGLGTVVEALQITQRKKFVEIPQDTPLLFVGEYYRKLNEVFNDMEAQGFISDKLDMLYQFVPEPQQMVEILLKFFSNRTPQE